MNIARIGLCVLLVFGSAHLLAQDEYKKAYQLYKAGKYNEALPQVDEAIASNPDWYFPIFLKGQINLKLKNYKEGLRNLNDVLTMELESKEIPKVKYYIMKGYMGMKEYRKVTHAVDDLVNLVPKSRHFDLYMNKGQAEMQLAKAAESKSQKEASGYFSKAIVSFSNALKNKAPNSNLETEAAFQKAFAQYKIGNYDGSMRSLEKSIAEFRDVVTRNPKEKRAHRFLIELGFRAAKQTAENVRGPKYREAVQHIDRYLSHWPNDPGMMEKKGQALQGAKQYNEAVEVFKLVGKLKPNDGNVLFQLGACQMASKNYTDANASFQKALNKGADKNPGLYTYMAYSYQQQKTGCSQTDIPLYQKAVSVLERGVGKLSGQAKSVLQSDLKRKKENLAILQDNLNAENQNHLATLENVRTLTKAITGNQSKLERNNELYLRQPTEELKKAIDEGRGTLQKDKTSLNKELDTLTKYVADARRCGANKYTHFNDMVAMLKQNSRS